MESAAKRKAANGVAHENEGRPAKRQKGPVSAASCDCASIVGGAPDTMEKRRLSGAGCSWMDGQSARHLALDELPFNTTSADPLHARSSTANAPPTTTLCDTTEEEHSLSSKTKIANVMDCCAGGRRPRARDG